MPGAEGGKEIPETKGVLSQQDTAKTPVKEPIQITTLADKPEEKEEVKELIMTGRIFIFLRKRLLYSLRAGFILCF